MQYLSSILTVLCSIALSLILLAAGGACGTIQTKPKLQQEIIELGCKKDQGLMILYKEGEYYFPAELPGACRCFIDIDGREYISTAGHISSKCKDSE